MANYKPRIPVEDEYILVLGRAAYNFTYLEWGIIWLTETMSTGFLIQAKTMTAGQIAKKFESESQNVDDDAKDKGRITALAKNFLDLKDKRNELLHANPYTAEKGEQRLLYSSKSNRQDWTIFEIEKTAKAFEDAAIEAGDLLHNGRYELYQKQKKNN